MLVDNSLPPHLAADFSDFINTDLFAPTNSFNSSSPSSDNDSSPPQSPFRSFLTTPPQDLPPAAFPDFDSSASASTSAAGASFSFFEDDPLKSIDPTSFDFLSLPGMESISLNYPGNPMSMPMDLSMGMNMDTGIPVDGPSASDLASYLGIDPSLVGTPAPSLSTPELETIEEESSDEGSEPNSQQKPKQDSKQDDQRERLTLTITPAKVGGYGKSRKGTVQSGGIVKRNANPPTSHSRDKENSGLLSTTSGQTAAAIAANAAALKRAKARAVSEAASSVDDESFSPAPSGAGPLLSNQDDLAIDWRPAPEVLAKMTSKEKRQLRNKISARNFRVRRKEYITTLEGDIAERDRLLDAIRTELGSTQSENLALRHEIEALKKILLEGRGGAEALASLNLPPPAPLALSNSGAVSVFGSGSGSVAAVSGSVSLGETATSASAPTASSSACVIDPALTAHSSATNANVSLALPTPSASPLLTPNTQKDLPTSPRLGAAAFWGGTTRSSFGMGMGGGITPVHTVLIPDISFGAGVGGDISRGEQSVTRALQENMNPALNRSFASKNVNVSPNLGVVSNGGGFEGWADLNPLTMKTLDAYRMHLWGKMAAQQQFQRNQQVQTHRASGPVLTGLASNLRPHFFASPSSSMYPTPPSTPPLGHSQSHHGALMGSSLSALLSSKHSASSSSSSYSGLHTPPGSPSLKGVSDKEEDRFREREREQREHAALAALAGQTLFKKLGSAFWDAFSGNTSTAASTSPNRSTKDFDVDKVRKVLEGKAVVRVVDVDSTPGPMSALTANLSGMSIDDKKVHEKKCPCGSILEESMKSLTISKKA